MSDFYIRFDNNLVSVSRIIDGELEAIRIKGDIYTPLGDFWLRFKQKIEYVHEETLAFVVFSDIQTFEIDPAIAIADEFSSDINNLVYEYSMGNNFVLTFPNLEVEHVKTKPLIKRNQIDLDVNHQIEGDSLQSYFKKKTKELLKGNQR